MADDRCSSPARRRAVSSAASSSTIAARLRIDRARKYPPARRTVSTATPISQMMAAAPATTSAEIETVSLTAGGKRHRLLRLHGGAAFSQDERRGRRDRIGRRNRTQEQDEGGEGREDQRSTERDRRRPVLFARRSTRTPGTPDRKDNTDDGGFPQDQQQRPASDDRVPGSRSRWPTRQSFRPPFDLLEQCAYFLKFGCIDFTARERALEQPSCGAVEDLVQDRCRQLTLGLDSTLRRLVDVRPEALGSREQPLLVHHLHLLEDGGVADGLHRRDGVVDFSDRRGAAIPEDPEDLEFGIGRAGSRSLGVPP